MGIKYYNPRSDVIKMEYVHEFYTECGNFPPEQIPQKLINKIEGIKRYVALDNRYTEQIAAADRKKHGG